MHNTVNNIKRTPTPTRKTLSKVIKTLGFIATILFIISLFTAKGNANEINNFFICQTVKSDLIEFVDAIQNTRFSHQKEALRKELAGFNHVFMDNNCTYAPRTLNEALQGVFNGK